MMPVMQNLTILIPTLNAASSLPKTLASVAGCSVVVCDGGSSDASVEIAAQAGAQVIHPSQIAQATGRGAQLAAAAGRAETPWLLFLHADTRLSNNWRAVAEAHIARPEAENTAGYFRLVFDDHSRAARRVAGLANWRARVFGLPYGDQGLLISRRLYNAIGGYHPLPLMEDVDLMRRLKKHKGARLQPLAAEAMTSAVRYRQGGWWLRPMRNLLCLSLYFLGVPPARIQRLYS